MIRSFLVNQLKKIIENNILSSMRTNDPSQMKQWLALTHGGQFDVNCWYINFSRNNASLPERVLFESHKKYRQYQHAAWYERILPFLRRRNLAISQDYVKSIYSCWEIVSQEPQANESQVVPGLWQRCLLWTAKKLNASWAFQATSAFNKQQMIDLFNKYATPGRDLYIVDKLPGKDNKKYLRSYLMHPESQEAFYVKSTGEMEPVTLNVTRPIENKKAYFPNDEIDDLIINTANHNSQDEINPPLTHNIEHLFAKSTDAIVFPHEPETVIPAEENTQLSHWIKPIQINHQIEFKIAQQLQSNYMQDQETRVDIHHLSGQNVRYQEDYAAQDNSATVNSKNIGKTVNKWVDHFSQLIGKSWIYELAAKSSEKFLQETLVAHPKHEVDWAGWAWGTCRESKNGYSSIIGDDKTGWCFRMKDLPKEIPEQRLEFHISEKALKVLEDAKVTDITTSTLPLGFFLDCENSITEPGPDRLSKAAPEPLTKYILRFDPKLREYQLQNSENCLSVDIYEQDSLESKTGTDDEKKVEGSNYFFDFFKQNNLTLPQVPALSPYEMRCILDAVTMSTDNQLQTDLSGMIAPDLVVNKTLFQMGYCVVHKEMQAKTMGSDEINNRIFRRAKDPHIIHMDEFANCQYPQGENKAVDSLLGRYRYRSYNKNQIRDQLNRETIINYRAVYLRYIAQHCNGAAFKKALVEWQRITGENLITGEGMVSSKVSESERIHEIHSLLQLNWGQLVGFAKSLPTKFDLSSRVNMNYLTELLNTSTGKKVNKVNIKPVYSFIYSENDINELFENLTLEQEMIDILRDDITKMNQLESEYKRLLPAELNLALGNAKSSYRLNGIVSVLALLREAYFRLSGGNWLRLEQSIAVLAVLRGQGRLLQIDTSDGKTLILCLMSILQALQGHKVDVITHNEKFAQEGAEGSQTLASLVGLSVCHKDCPPLQIIDADIFYIDIANAVINDRQRFVGELKNEQIMAIGNRRPDIADIDEVDNVVYDIHANTTMQISEGGSSEKDETFYEFLNALNQIIRIDPEFKTIVQKEQQREYIQKQLQKYPYYQEKVQDIDTIDNWISAAVTAYLTLKEKEDYVIEREGGRHVVHIAHKQTTGRVDKISHWGEGVHQCVAAWENSIKSQDICIPPISQVIAEGNVVHYLQNRYARRYGVTGTKGEDVVSRAIENFLQVGAPTLIFPRAKRTAPENIEWPKVRVESDDEQDYKMKTIYSRSYHNPPQILSNKTEHYQQLLTAIKNIQSQEYSAIIFFNTITECDMFAGFLKANRISNIQILDDTHPDAEEKEATSLRPSEDTIILQANKQKMITLTTAAGSRGTDFDNVTFQIAAKPGLNRILLQKRSRGGRNGQLGVSHEIYNAEDLGVELTGERPILDASTVISHDFRATVKTYESNEQNIDRQRIQLRAPSHEMKHVEQERILAAVNQNRTIQNQLIKDWVSFFPMIGKTASSLDEPCVKETSYAGSM